MDSTRTSRAGPVTSMRPRRRAAVIETWPMCHLASHSDVVDTTTVALAAVGITLTVATVFSLGATLPEKAGVSTIKIVNRAGRLSRPLRRQVFTLAREAVDVDALKNVGRSLGEAGWQEGGTATAHDGGEP